MQKFALVFLLYCKNYSTYLSDWPGGHDNPVRAGIVNKAEEYTSSSAADYFMESK